MGGDKLFDQQRFVAGARERNFTPHVAQNTTNRRSAIDGRTTRHAGYAISQRRRKLAEQELGWKKTTGWLRKLRHRGRDKVDWIFTFTAGVYDMVRIRTLERAGVCSCGGVSPRARLHPKAWPITSALARSSRCLDSTI